MALEVAEAPHPEEQVAQDQQRPALPHDLERARGSQGVWLGGAVYEATGAYDAMWWIAIALALGAAAVHMPIHERRAPGWVPSPA